MDNELDNLNIRLDVKGVGKLSYFVHLNLAMLSFTQIEDHCIYL